MAIRFGNGYHGRVYLNPHQLFRYAVHHLALRAGPVDVLPGTIRSRLTEWSPGQ